MALSEKIDVTPKHFFPFSILFLGSLSLALWLSSYVLLTCPFCILLLYYGWQHWKHLFFLLILVLPWSVEYHITRSLGTDFPDEPLMWMATIFVAGYLIWRPGDCRNDWKHPLIAFLFLYLGWLFITIPFSTDWLISLKFFLAKTWYVCAFVLLPLLLFRSKKIIITSGLILLVSLLLVSVLIFCRHAELEFKFVNINAAVSPFFRNHVNYSAMLVCAIPLLVVVYNLHVPSRAIIIALILFVITALYLSYARGAWLALIVGLLAYGLIRLRMLLMIYIVTIILAIGSVFWLSTNDRYLSFANDYKKTIFHQDFQQHLIATYQLKDLSTAERFNRWVAGVRMLPHIGATGFGPNTFYENYKPYESPAFRTWVSNNPEHSTVHNYFLLTLIEQGIPGLLLFLLITAAGIYYAEKLYSQLVDPVYRNIVMACGVIIAMLVTVNMLSDLVESDKTGSLLFLSIATLVSADMQARRRLNG